VVLRWIALHANADGVSRAALTSIAGYVRPELEQLKGHHFDDPNSAVTDVSRAVHRLDEYGALSGADTLPDRRMWLDVDEWPGELTVDPDLRAITHEGTVRDLLA